MFILYNLIEFLLNFLEDNFRAVVFVVVAVVVILALIANGQGKRIVLTTKPKQNNDTQNKKH